MSQNGTPKSDNPAKPRRRWFQFSLRSLLIFTTIMAVWFGWMTHKARQQRDVVAELRELGAIVKYDLPHWPYLKDRVLHEWDEDFDELQKKHNTFWPVWLIDLMGIDYFASIKSVRIPVDAKITEADLARLKRAISNRTAIIDNRRNEHQKECRPDHP